MSSETKAQKKAIENRAVQIPEIIVLDDLKQDFEFVINLVLFGVFNAEYEDEIDISKLLHFDCSKLSPAQAQLFTNFKQYFLATTGADKLTPDMRH